LVSKNIKIKTQRTVILPAVLNGREAWPLTMKAEHRPRVFENRVLRRIFGPRRGSGEEQTAKSFMICVPHQILFV
jgi:hypothetical protein